MSMCFESALQKGAQSENTKAGRGLTREAHPCSLSSLSLLKSIHINVCVLCGAVYGYEK